VDQVAPRDGGEDADVVVRAGVHAVEAGGAVEVADLARHEQVELAAAPGRIAAQAVVRRTGRAHRRRAGAHLQPGGHRGDEVELPDRADVLAEGRAGAGGVGR